MATTQVDADQDAGRSVRQRQLALRSGTTGAFNIQMNVDGQPVALDESFSGSGLGAGSSVPGLGFFLYGNVATGDKDASFRETAFDYYTLGITGGVDYRFTPDFIAGAAIGYAFNKADFEDGGSEIETDAFSFFGYATFFPTDRVYVDATIGYTLTDFDQDRVLNYTIAGTTVNNAALSSTNGDDLSASIQVGYDWSVREGSITAPTPECNTPRPRSMPIAKECAIRPRRAVAWRSPSIAKISNHSPLRLVCRFRIASIPAGVRSHR